MSDEICINARTLDGRSREIKISKELTISDLKGKIEQATQMPKSRQRIIYQGRVLKVRSRGFRFLCSQYES